MRKVLILTMLLFSLVFSLAQAQLAKWGVMVQAPILQGDEVFDTPDMFKINFLRKALVQKGHPVSLEGARELWKAYEFRDKAKVYDVVDSFKTIERPKLWKTVNVDVKDGLRTEYGIVPRAYGLEAPRKAALARDAIEIMTKFDQVTYCQANSVLR